VAAAAREALGCAALREGVKVGKYRGCPIIRRFYYKKIRPVWQKSFRRFRAGRHFGGQAPASTFFATNKGKKVRTPCLKLYYFTQ
jgi:hypothetical protein